MSAFICGPDLIKSVVVFATQPRDRCSPPTPRVDPRYLDIKAPATPGGRDLSRLELANLYADILYQENVRSVRHRYPGEALTSLPGPRIYNGHVTLKAKDFTAPQFNVGALQVLKFLDCLQYQSCETDDYKSTVAFRLLDAIRSAAISALPGYDQAKWDYYAEDAEA